MRILLREQRKSTRRRQERNRKKPRSPGFKGERARLSNPTEAKVCGLKSVSVGIFHSCAFTPCILTELLFGGLDQGRVCLS